MSIAFVGATGARADFVPDADGYTYEITRPREDWLKQLGQHDFDILRLGKTEVPKSSSVWNETRSGDYHCKGCQLPNYTSKWKVELDKGWTFFRQSLTNSLLMSVDWPDGAADVAGLEDLAAIEVHCRRCGSHMGHILLVDGALLHCINGASLTFHKAAA